MTFLEWLHNKSMCKGKSHLKLDFLTKNFLGEDTINKHFIWTPSKKKIKENVKPGNFNMNPSMTFGGCFWGPLTSEWKATHLLSNCWCCNIISLTRLLKWFLIRVSLVSLSLAPLVTWSSCPSCRKSNKNYYMIKFQAQVNQTVLLPVLFSTCSQKDDMFHNLLINAVSSIQENLWAVEHV